MSPLSEIDLAVNHMTGRAFRLFKKGQIMCCIPRLPLLPGRYGVSVWCKIDEQMADGVQDAVTVDVVGGDFFGTGKLHPDDGGSLLLSHTWEAI